MKCFVRSSVLLILCCLASASFSQTGSFRFAWLSDTHVGSTTGAADLGNSIREINAISGVAFVVLSGDITEMGFDAQLDLAKAILDSLKKPYYIIPGNHDTKWSPSGCTKFTSLWGKDRFVFEYSGYRFLGMHEGPIMKMGDGHFPPEDLRWLDSVLITFSNKRQPLFFVTHYPLDPGIDNWYALTERLKLFNTQAVLVGHEHENRVADFEGLPGIVMRALMTVSLGPRGHRGGVARVSEARRGRPRVIDRPSSQGPCQDRTRIVHTPPNAEAMARTGSRDQGFLSQHDIVPAARFFYQQEVYKRQGAVDSECRLHNRFNPFIVG